MPGQLRPRDKTVTPTVVKVFDTAPQRRLKRERTLKRINCSSFPPGRKPGRHGLLEGRWSESPAQVVELKKGSKRFCNLSHLIRKCQGALNQGSHRIPRTPQSWSSQWVVGLLVRVPYRALLSLGESLPKEPGHYPYACFLVRSSGVAGIRVRLNLNGESTVNMQRCVGE